MKIIFLNFLSSNFFSILKYIPLFSSQLFDTNLCVLPEKSLLLQFLLPPMFELFSNLHKLYTLYKIYCWILVNYYYWYLFRAANSIWGSSVKEYYCVDSSSHMNSLSEEILKGSEPDIIKRIFYRQFLPSNCDVYILWVSNYFLPVKSIHKNFLFWTLKLILD